MIVYYNTFSHLKKTRFLQCRVCTHSNFNILALHHIQINFQSLPMHSHHLFNLTQICFYVINNRLDVIVTLQKVFGNFMYISVIISSLYTPLKELQHLFILIFHYMMMGVLTIIV